jgi:protein-disulfide isomerase
LTEIKDTVPGFVNNRRTLADAPDSIGDAAARREAGMTSDAAPGKAQARWRSVLDIVAVVLAIVASVVLIVVGLRAWFSPMAPPAAKLSAHRDPPLPTEPLSLEGAALKGSKTAKVAMVEYSEFECPYSGKFVREILPSLEQKYVAAGRVLLAFRNFPLDSHPFAKRAAAAGVCANQQAKFWQAHDLFFRADSPLDEATIEKATAQLGLDGSRFSACLAREATSQVSDDIARGRALQVSGTPTFFIGTIQPDGRVKAMRAVYGARPVATFETALDQVIQESMWPGR